MPRASYGSTTQDPLGLDIEGVDRLARGHEQAVALLAAETHIGAALGQHDTADHLAVGSVDDDPVLGLATGPCAPDVAVRVDTEAVAAAWLGAAELAPVGRLGAIVDHIVDLYRSLTRAGRVDDVEQFFVGREGEPVRPFHVVDCDRHGAGTGVEPVDPERQFPRRLMPEVIAAGAGAVVTEPDRPVRFDDDVVGGGQALALEAVGEHRDRAVVFGAGQPLRIHLAREQAALAVAGVAVGVIRGAAKHADRAGFLLPFQDPVVRDVAPQEVATIAEPHWPLGKAAAASDALDRRVAQHIWP